MDQRHDFGDIKKSGKGIDVMSFRFFPFIHPAPRTVRRDHAEEQAPPRSQYAAAFFQCQAGVCEETKRECQENSIERILLKGEVFSQSRIGHDATPRCDFQHGYRWIDPSGYTQDGSKTSGTDSHFQPAPLEMGTKRAKTFYFCGENGLSFI